MLRALRFLTLSLPCLLQAAPPKPGVDGFFGQNCTECHDADVKKGGLDLTAISWNPETRENFDLWVKIHDRVNKGEMPPKKSERPDAKAVTGFLASVSKPLRDISAQQQTANGRTVLRRLNRNEYERTVQDLLGIDIPLAGLLPEDTPAHGFDTVAEGLRISQLQLEKYLEAADEALEAAMSPKERSELIKGHYSYKDEKNILKNLELPDEPPTDPKKKYSRQRQMFRMLPDGVALFTDADYLLGLGQFRVRRTGTYRVKVSAQAYQSAGKDINLRLYGNNFRTKRLLAQYDFPEDKPRVVEFTTRIENGEHLLLAPTKVGYDEDGKRLNDYDTTKDFKGRGLNIQWVEVEGPLESQVWPPASVVKLFGAENVKSVDNSKQKKPETYEVKPADPQAEVKKVIESFATRAYRRPLEAGEVDDFVKMAQESLTKGESFSYAAQLGIRGVLTSTPFLLFSEAPGKLDDYALASRLSYFLWSTLPDEELLKLAAAKQLSQPDTLRTQVERMLKDKRSGDFVTNFTGQWLDLRSIDATSPDMNLYPEFDEMLKRAMIAETEEFFREVLTKNLPVTNFIQSDFAMLNSRIAEHYGIDGVRGEQFQRVSLPTDSVRGGVLTQASILKITANGTVTSPVLRGAWVMKRLLGDPPAPPPPGVGSVEPDTRGATTIRELLDKHRHAESCMGCHSKIDPAGFALESFDVIGGWRDRYRSKEKGERPATKIENRGVWQYKLALPVDTTGALPDGRAFAGIRDFKKLILDKPEDLQRCIAEKLLTYATGAGITFADRSAVADIVQKTNQQGGGLRTLVTEVVLSSTFQNK
jgi:hypothetical protein